MAWKKQVVKFGIVGVTSSLIDLAVYSMIFYLFGVIPSISKAIGFISGSIFGYLVNRRWTFRSTSSVKSNIVQYVILYLTSLTLNVGINSAVLFLLGKGHFYSVLVAFVIATGAAALRNFLGLK
ncbi:MAG: GtrA family protein, partial [Aurantimicrobium sp.]